MSGDIAFDTELKRCINVDIRYVLFVIDKYAGATNLNSGNDAGGREVIFILPSAIIKIENGWMAKDVIHI